MGTIMHHRKLPPLPSRFRLLLLAAASLGALAAGSAAAATAARDPLPAWQGLFNAYVAAHPDLTGDPAFTSSFAMMQSCTPASPPNAGRRQMASHDLMQLGDLAAGSTVRLRLATHLGVDQSGVVDFNPLPPGSIIPVTAPDPEPGCAPVSGEWPQRFSVHLANGAAIGDIASPEASSLAGQPAWVEMDAVVDHMGATGATVPVEMHVVSARVLLANARLLKTYDATELATSGNEGTLASPFASNDQKVGLAWFAFNGMSPPAGAPVVADLAANPMAITQTMALDSTVSAVPGGIAITALASGWSVPVAAFNQNFSLGFVNASEFHIVPVPGDMSSAVAGGAPAQVEVTFTPVGAAPAHGDAPKLVMAHIETVTLTVRPFGQPPMIRTVRTTSVATPWHPSVDSRTAMDFDISGLRPGQDSATAIAAARQNFSVRLTPSGGRLVPPAATCPLDGAGQPIPRAAGDYRCVVADLDAAGLVRRAQVVSAVPGDQSNALVSVLMDRYGEPTARGGELRVNGEPVPGIVLGWGAVALDGSTPMTARLWQDGSYTYEMLTVGTR